MEQQPLFFEDVYEALRHLVQSCGGAKQVGHAIYPAKPVDQAATALLDTLNPNRREKLDPEQLIQLLAIGRQQDCHSAVHFIARSLGYSEPHPIDPEDEKALLMRDFNQHVDKLDALYRRIKATGLQR